MPLRSVLLQSKIREPQVASCIENSKSLISKSRLHFQVQPQFSAACMYFKINCFHHRIHTVFHMQPCLTSRKNEIQEVNLTYNNTTLAVKVQRGHNHLAAGPYYGKYELTTSKERPTSSYYKYLECCLPLEHCY